MDSPDDDTTQANDSATTKDLCKPRRSKSTLKNMEYSYSDNEDEDDPEFQESSGEEWSEPEQPIQKKRVTRKVSAKTNKKFKTDNSSSSDAEDEAPLKTKHRNGASRLPRSEDDKDQFRVKKVNAPKTYAKTYATGSFVILKKDAQVGDPSKHPCIWRIDGKALLQKYEPFVDKDGKVMHKTTSVYTGWSVLDRDQYAHIKIKVREHANQMMTVEIDWEKLKEIVLDSD